MTEVLPILYCATVAGDFRASVPALLGEDAAWLSTPSVTRRTAI
jgi:hypothetical protein